MAKSKKQQTKSKVSSAKTSTRSALKNGPGKQLTIEKSMKKGYTAGTAGKGNTTLLELEDSSDDENYANMVDTEEEEEEEEEEHSNKDKTNEVVMLDRIEEMTPTEPDVNENGKRPQQQKTLPSSILRHNIRAKHKASIVVNPYTPKLNTINFSDTTARQVPIKDCTTKWRSRFTVKLSIPESTNALEAFRELLKGLVSELQATCDDSEKIFILPWAEADRTKINAIESPEDVPVGMTKLGKFIPRFFPGKGDAMMSYFKLYIGHDKELDELQADIKYWLMSGNHGMYFESLQCEHSVFIGWLLWSLKTMDVNALTEDILQMTGIHVGLRWMAIDSGAKGKVPLSEKVFALHMEVARSDKRKAKKAFLALYGKQNNDSAELPLYLRLRFITPRSEATSGATITKLKRFRERQKNFLVKIGKSAAPQIVHLDWRKQEKQQTLRELMMELKSNVYENTPIFFSVDLDWTKTNHIVSYLPMMKEEAVHTLNTLIPLLRFVIQNQESSEHFEPLVIDDLHSFFTDESIEDSEDMFFDPKLNRVVDPLMDENLEFIDDENLLGDDDMDANAIPVQRPELQQLQTGNFPGNCDDSISTLGRSLATGMLSPGALSSQSRSSRRSRSSASVSSVSTGVTVEDFTNLKRDVHSITSAVDNLARLVAGTLKDSTSQVAFSPSVANASTGAGSL